MFCYITALKNSTTLGTKPGKHSCSESFEGRPWASQVVLMMKNLPANAGGIRDMGSIPGLERSPGGGHGNPFQYSCLENPMDGEAWQATVYRVTRVRQDWRDLAHTYGVTCCLYSGTVNMDHRLLSPSSVNVCITDIYLACPASLLVWYHFLSHSQSIEFW